jgi:homoserine kinase
MGERPLTVRKPRTLRVTVPATSANLGAGFDVLGLALDLHNVFTVAQADEDKVEICGYSGDVPSDRSNLFYKAFKHLHDLSEKPTPTVHIGMELRVPPGLGLGSSATAVVGGLVAANVFLDGAFGEGDLLREAVKLEHGGHADNVAPALMGGLVVNVMDGDNVMSVRVPFPDELKAVVFTPDFPMDTVQGRALLPANYPRADVIFNASRVALFLAALSRKRYDLLRVAMQDRVHQPYRAQLFPLLPGLIKAALSAGAHGACLSGGGSSVLALATEGLDKIGAAMTRKGEATGMRGDVRILNIDHKGAEATWLEAESGA